jgi:hypothetical protein
MVPTTCSGRSSATAARNIDPGAAGMAIVFPMLKQLRNGDTPERPRQSAANYATYSVN